ncbi:MAG: hypothetical protein VX589_09595 [Myxococcota bacterium]|nr:hypothetical protein [Myxococcota bacterium]
MSDQHLHDVETLIQLCSATRDEVRRDGAVNLDQFDQQFDAAFERLVQVNATLEEGEQRTAVRHRLRDLERIRQQLASELVELRLQMAQRLTGVSRGRRGLNGYRAALSGPVRGARRGRG